MSRLTVLIYENRPYEGNWVELRYSSIQSETRNSVLKALSQSLKGQKSIQKVSFNFQG